MCKKDTEKVVLVKCHLSLFIYSQLTFVRNQHLATDIILYSLCLSKKKNHTHKKSVFQEKSYEEMCS